MVSGTTVSDDFETIHAACSKCEDTLDVGWYPFGLQGETDNIKWMFFCGHGYEVVMNFNRNTIKRLVESLL